MKWRFRGLFDVWVLWLLVDRMVDRMVDRLVYRLVDWLIEWLALMVVPLVG